MPSVVRMLPRPLAGLSEIQPPAKRGEFFFPIRRCRATVTEVLHPGGNVSRRGTDVLSPSNDDVKNELELHPTSSPSICLHSVHRDLTKHVSTFYKKRQVVMSCSHVRTSLTGRAQSSARFEDLTQVFSKISVFWDTRLPWLVNSDHAKKQAAFTFRSSSLRNVVCRPKFWCRTDTVSTYCQALKLLCGRFHKHRLCTFCHGNEGLFCTVSNKKTVRNS
jgi:hypothetical protein